MLKLRYLAASIVLVSCAARPISSPTLILTPMISNGSVKTQTLTPPYTKTSIQHLDLKLYTVNGSEQDTGVARTLVNAQLDNPIVFAALKPNTTYRIKAYAYASVDNSLLISATASTDVILTNDDRPTLLPLNVQLIDRAFDGQATSSINLVNGGFSPIGAELLAFPKQVTTIAGVGRVAGSTDGVGLAARFNQPCGVTADSSGNIYIADAANALIRKISPLGTVSTIAGSAGATGWIDATGAAARFNFPWGISADNSGNLFVTDRYNHTVRKIVISTGAVSTVAGGGTAAFADGTGVNARFNMPFGVIPDNSGNLYVADRNNHVLRKVVISTGAVTTIAGSGGATGSVDATGTSARFYQPEDMVLDGAGNLYITDTYNFLIRKMNLTTGYVSTVAGQAGVPGSQDGIGTAAQFSTPVGIIKDFQGNLFVADYGSSVIRKIIPSTGEVVTVAGQAGTNGTSDGVGTLATFWQPEQLTIDQNGNIFVADRGSHLIRKLQ